MNNGNELIKLRVSIARVAQKAGLGDHIPGFRTTASGQGQNANFQLLSIAAKSQERGWNALLARIMDHVIVEEERDRSVDINEPVPEEKSS